MNIFEISVPSQVVVARTLSKKQMLMSVATKIAIQLNCKLGGEVWHLEIPVCKLIYILKIFLGFIGKIGVKLRHGMYLVSTTPTKLLIEFLRNFTQL